MCYLAVLEGCALRTEISLNFFFFFPYVEKSASKVTFMGVAHPDLFQGERECSRERTRLLVTSFNIASQSIIIIKRINSNRVIINLYIVPRK